MPKSNLIKYFEINSRVIFRNISLLIILLVFGSVVVVAQDVAEAEKQAKEVIAKNKEAIGGKKNLDKIKTIETVSETNRNGTITKTTRIQDKINKRFYMVSEGGMEGKLERGFDGKRSWTKSPITRGYDKNPIVSNTSDSFIRMPNETIDGVEYVVLQSSTKGENSRTLKQYYDAKDYLLRRTTMTGTVSGYPVNQVILYDDYRKVDGVLIAFKETISVAGGRSSSTRKVLSVRHNVEVEDSLFQFSEGDSKDEKTSDVKFVNTSWDKYSPESIVPKDIKQKAFEEVWSRIYDTYFDRTFNGVDWNGVKKKYEPLVRKVRTNAELNALLSEMIGELQKSHFRIVPAERVATTDSKKPKLGTTGLDLRLTEDSRIVVVKTDPNSAGENAGIKIGYEITKINSKPIDEIIKESKKQKGFQLRNELTAIRSVRAKMIGKIGDEISITFIDENNKERKVALSVAESDDPRANSQIVTKQLTEDIGYVKIKIFLGNVPNDLEAALKKLPAKALIIDLRGNPGGIGNHSIAVASLLNRKGNTLGSSNHRYSSAVHKYEGKEDAFDGKLFILVDELTGSTSEILASGLQSNKRAVIVGRRTAGAVLASIQHPLPNGAFLQHAVADFKSPDGVEIEGRGVIPDFEVKLTRDDLLKGKDAVIEKAKKLAEDCP